MKSLFKHAVATLFFCVLCCTHAAVNAEEAKTDSTAQSGVAAAGSKEATKTDDAKKKSSTEAEPECNN